MELVKVGKTYGVYQVLSKSTKRTNKGNNRYDCLCTVCGGERTFAEGYLLKLANLRECICEKEERKLEIRREFECFMKDYGKINLCGYCKHMFDCVRYKYNAVDKRYMKKWYIDTVRDFKKRKNIIIVLQCDRFEFDWGEKK